MKNNNNASRLSKEISGIYSNDVSLSHQSVFRNSIISRNPSIVLNKFQFFSNDENDIDNNNNNNSQLKGKNQIYNNDQNLYNNNNNFIRTSLQKEITNNNNNNNDIPNFVNMKSNSNIKAQIYENNKGIYF
jgi:hypothetical protein